jgi:hypothetical protein
MSEENVYILADLLIIFRVWYIIKAVTPNREVGLVTGAPEY